MFRVVQSGNVKPFSFPVHPSAEFLPGQVAQLMVMGNNVFVGVSNGLSPLGIIDDIKSSSYSSTSVDEVVVTGLIAGTVGPGGRLITPTDVRIPLRNAGISPDSFVSDPVDVELEPRNGNVIFLAGTELNIDLDGDGILDGIRTVVSYTYFVPNVPGENSTAGSGRVAVWINRIIGQTDQFDTTQRYPINAPLFVNEYGKLTSRKPGENYPGIGIVTGSPSSVFGSLEFLMY